MNHCNIGIDIGTSYLKSAAIDVTGISILSHTINTPNLCTNNSVADPVFAHSVFESFKTLLTKTFIDCAVENYQIDSVCLTGISPVLVLFDSDNFNTVLSSPYWHLPAIDGHLTGSKRSMKRVEFLAQKAAEIGVKRPAILDLLGYIAFRLTGDKCINNLTCAELGCFSDQKIQLPYFEETKVVKPTTICGRTKYLEEVNKSPVNIHLGGPDSFTTALASGAIKKGSLMIYLGTFGSLLEVNNDLLYLLKNRMDMKNMPYRWIVSVPGFGRKIEELAKLLFPDLDQDSGFIAMETAAQNCAPGANKHYLRLPSWDGIGSTIGQYRFVPIDRRQSNSETSRSALEALGHRLLATHHSKILDAQEVFISGGGVKSNGWVQMLTNVIGRSIISKQNKFDGAHFAAAIPWLTQGNIQPIQSCLDNQRVFDTDTAAHSLIAKTTQLAAQYYETETRLFNR